MKLADTTEILNSNREIYMDAVQKIFKLEKEIQEIRPMIQKFQNQVIQLLILLHNPI